MKKIILLLFFSFITFTSNHAQAIYEDKDSLFLTICDKLSRIEDSVSNSNRYKLYKTENFYNFLKLDTMTGKIEQIQWSLDYENEGIVTINDVDLTLGLGNMACVFELYPTHNMYQFILLDKQSGRVWHVQWGTSSSKRWIKRIYK